MSLLPPDEGSEYASRQSMLEAVQSHAKENGYAVTIHRSSTKDGTVYLGCDRGGRYRARYGIRDDTRIRDTGTRLTGCPFSIRAAVKDSVWTFKIRNPAHNHLPSIHPIAHPMHRRLPSELVTQVKTMSASGIAPREIVTTLQQTSDYPVLGRDISNVRQKLRLESLGGKSPIEGLIALLSESNWTWEYRTDGIGRITHLFFAHPRSIELLQQYPEVLLLDCTYKTNKFKMPLLNIVGTTCLGRNFYVAFAFLVKEEEEDYQWAMEQLQGLFIDPNQLKVAVTDRELALMSSIRSVFPQSQRILCIWHIEKNVLVKAQKYFTSEEARNEFMVVWKKLVYSSTPEVFDLNWTKLQESYDNDFPELTSYLWDTWLMPWKRLFIRAYIDQYPHFGNTVTSRVEGAHSKLKSSLKVSTGDLKVVFEKIHLLLCNEHMEHDGALSRDRVRTPHTAKDPLYSQLLGRISNFALGKIWQQRHRLVALEPLPPCTRMFSQSMGLPCAHQIQERLQQQQTLLLEDVHRHWYYHPQALPVMIPLILDPAIVQPRGRPAVKLNPPKGHLNRAATARQAKSSTRRNPSAFEQVALHAQHRTDVFTGTEAGRTTRSGRNF